MREQITDLTKRIRKLPWSFRQPLTLRPPTETTVISDLFFWFSGEKIHTCFELLNLAALFGVSADDSVTISYFDSEGRVIFTKDISLEGVPRLRLNVTELLNRYVASDISGTYGVFAIFHKVSPRIVVQCRSYISERGYASYYREGVDLMSYVHGNYDAIGLEGQNIYPLGGVGYLTRSYNLQYKFVPTIEYWIGITNPSPKKIKFKMILLSIATHQEIARFNIVLNALGSTVLKLCDQNEEFRLSLRSKLVMARPIVFVRDQESLDVFHG